MEFLGTSFIGNERGRESGDTFTAFDPLKGIAVEPAFHSASLEELERAAALAGTASFKYGKISGKDKADFLRKIAENIEALGDQLLNRAALETGLTIVRFEGERARTCAQLRMFADMLSEGSWVDARIDHADPDRKPLPKPDLRSMLRPLGTVAVFCASNFPLAYSVAGGDTASSLAAGCPVIVNAHSAHPGTAELVGFAISEAVKSCGMPEGTFSMLFSSDYKIGQALVRHPNIKAVGFTGSRKGGLALSAIAAGREEPIPVFAEMSAVNPIFILPEALAERSAAIADGLYKSFTGGGGQFCTKPGVVVLSDTNNSSEFCDTVEELTTQTAPFTLLTEGIRDAYKKGIEERSKKAVGISAEGSVEGYAVNAAVFRTDAKQFIADPSMGEEVFGPDTLFVDAADKESLLKVARGLEGQLTASVHGSEKDLRDFAELIEILETKAGRLIINGYPTGVEVNYSIVHGGPFPATTDTRTTSVGARAIFRFVRPVCYQNFPSELLPEELKDENTLSIRRFINGKLT